jgi:hypothetical protein
LYEPVALSDAVLIKTHRAPVRGRSNHRYAKIKRPGSGRYQRNRRRITHQHKGIAMQEFPPPKYIDDVTCHERWCETTQVLFGPPGTAKVEFCVYRWTPDVPVHIDRVSPVARVTMTLASAKTLQDQLAALLTAVAQQEQLAQAPPASAAKN